MCDCLNDYGDCLDNLGCNEIESLLFHQMCHVYNCPCSYEDTGLTNADKAMIAITIGCIGLVAFPYSHCLIWD